MADRFVSDPHEVVRSGQVVRVKVVEVDVDRQRIGLTMRLNDEPKRGQGNRNERPDRGGESRKKRPNPPRSNDSGRREPAQPMGSLGQALRDAGFGK
jgi:protein Tex